MSELLSNTFEQGLAETRQELAEFLRECRESVERNVRALKQPLERLSYDDRVAFFQRLTSYVEFELLSDEQLYDIPVCVTGSGLVMVFDTDGEIIGVETMTDDTMVTGEIDDAIAQPTIPYRDLMQQLEDGVPSQEETASAVLILRDTTFLSGRTASGKYTDDQDLSEFRVGIPLIYPITVDVDVEMF